MNESTPTPEIIKPIYSVFNYDQHSLTEHQDIDLSTCINLPTNGRINWINMDGLIAEDVEQLCQHFEVHPLLIEDIMSQTERPKMEEMDKVIIAVLPMMYFNEYTGDIDHEQVSLILGKDFVLSFQEEAKRDVFNPVRKHLRDGSSKLRQRSSDYLLYSLLDVIVDSYFGVIEKLTDRIEQLEDVLIKRQNKLQLNRISQLRRDVSILRRTVVPVRELVANFVRSDSDLLEERNEKYYRDILDHTIQANDFVESQRDMLMNLQDLYMNQINLRMNEVMKTFTLLATLMAPATVLGGIFGMNFEQMPLLKSSYGFSIAVLAMVFIPLAMIIWFKRRGLY
ncbi:MAG: magnesium/cobalt transporter CorA [Bacteroidetes bacterium]|nr:magnesium/cobalt transporter CorA [Bacteroidota bacterium]